MKIKQHKESGLWVTDDGRVIMPPCPKYPYYRFTFGSRTRKGYMEVNYHGKVYRVHRLVAEAFLGDPPFSGATVDHYPDRNPSNNHASNLRWADIHMQNDNRQICEDSLAKYGVRKCQDSAGYQRARYANNPEFAERQRARCRARKQERYARDPEFAERERAYSREYEAKQRALGRRRRRCPDGKERWLTDAEYNKRYKEESV
jgi:hypothetical protein